MLYLRISGTRLCVHVAGTVDTRTTDIFQMTLRPQSLPIAARQSTRDSHRMALARRFRVEVLGYSLTLVMMHTNDSVEVFRAIFPAASSRKPNTPMQIDLHRQYVEQGLIVVPHIYSAERVGRLRHICEHVLSQWRVLSPEDGRPHIDQANANSMRHLNHPGYFVGRREWLVELLDAVADPCVIDSVREVFNDDVLFRCTSLFMNPLITSSDGNWHRDSQFVTPNEEDDRSMVEAEAARLSLNGRIQGMQMQIALVPSEDSEYVPGSHLRWDTPEEYFIRLADNQKHNRSNLMPGAVRTHQEPGDAAAFHAFGLHRGRYHADKCRRTLMLSYNPVSCTPRCDYFSNQPWCLQPDYLEGTQPHTRAFFTRFIDRFRDYWADPKSLATV